MDYNTGSGEAGRDANHISSFPLDVVLFNGITERPDREFFRKYYSLYTSRIPTSYGDGMEEDVENLGGGNWILFIY